MKNTAETHEIVKDGSADPVDVVLKEVYQSLTSLSSALSDRFGHPMSLRRTLEYLLEETVQNRANCVADVTTTIAYQLPQVDMYTRRFLQKLAAEGGPRTLKELSELSIVEILRRPGAGRKTLNDIRAVLMTHGLDLAG